MMQLSVQHTNRIVWLLRLDRASKPLLLLQSLQLSSCSWPESRHGRARCTLFYRRARRKRRACGFRLRLMDHFHDFPPTRPRWLRHSFFRTLSRRSARKGKCPAGYSGKLPTDHPAIPGIDMASCQAFSFVVLWVPSCRSDNSFPCAGRVALHLGKRGAALPDHRQA